MTERLNPARSISLALVLGALTVASLGSGPRVTRLACGLLVLNVFEHTYARISASKERGFRGRRVSANSGRTPLLRPPQRRRANALPG